MDAVKESEAACVIKNVEDCRSSGWMKEFACGQCDASELARGVTWKEICAHLQEKYVVFTSIGDLLIMADILGMIDTASLSPARMIGGP